MESAWCSQHGESKQENNNERSHQSCIASCNRPRCGILHVLLDVVGQFCDWKRQVHKELDVRTQVEKSERQESIFLKERAGNADEK